MWSTGIHNAYLFTKSKDLHNRVRYYKCLSVLFFFFFFLAKDVYCISIFNCFISKSIFADMFRIVKQIKNRYVNAVLYVFYFNSIAYFIRNLNV